ncbi:hypothetical protein PV11_05155 [Exophiala sideris]|uniref:Histidine kinase n=1 Tax=Exophiala sideris TaxID=1016849 RepID=A0A0D1X5Y8_9EURO|nr:hypothetical protein PV11_05155 [Exophiala sideris]
MVSESARGREVLRYYQAWLDSATGYNQSTQSPGTEQYHTDGSRLRGSNDKALIAFAQLGCLKLGAKRAIVTLISESREYIIAEATKTLSFVSERGAQDEGDDLWFGNASMPRSQGMSQDALTPDNYTAVDSDGQALTVPALVVNDISQDDRYRQLGYAGAGVTFFCGVPIISKSGIPIGVFNVTDDKPRNGLNRSELEFLGEMAKITMIHLEYSRIDVARSRGEKMVGGLGRFLMGKSSLSDKVDPQVNDRGDAANPDEEPGSVPAKRNFLGMTITDADPKLLRDEIAKGSRPEILSSGKPIPSSDKEAISVTSQHHSPNLGDGKGFSPGKPSRNTGRSVRPAGPGNATDAAGEIQKIFTRAAKILRECASADGVVFYDAVSSNYAKRPDIADHQKQFSDTERERDVTTDESSSDSQDSLSSKSSSTESAGSESDQRPHMLSSKGTKCEILGYSLDVSSDSTSNARSIENLRLTESGLRRFIRRYPNGKIFYFSPDGNVSASEDDSASYLGQGLSTHRDRTAKRNDKQRSTRAIADELIRIVPGARNVLWLPLWDFSKQRWSAGTFLWSRRPDRLIAAQDDLAYLRTFGSSLMNEISRANAVFADETKATFLANISHELRSPLHGILGSVEFLQDTALNSFQSSMVTAVETCGKTLLDTVEHVLAYAKINQISKKYSKESSSKKAPKSDNPGVSTTANDTLEEDFDLSVMFEETVESVLAGQTFRPSASLPGQSRPIHSNQSRRGMSAEEIRSGVGRGADEFSSKVRLSLDIQRQDNWWVRTQPGAIRRILMNILGNALKYTEEGSIDIRFTAVERAAARHARKTVCLSIVDTGKGMSVDFLHNHAFTPFSQESQFSAGTGLGLSIVRHLVNSLGGKIEVQSEKGRGTDIKVWLTLPIVQPPSPLTRGQVLRESVMQQTPGMSICILKPKIPSGKDQEEENKGSGAKSAVEKSVRHTLKTWFGMHTIEAESMTGITTDFFMYVEPPPIQYFLEHHGRNGSAEREIPLIIMATNTFESASFSSNEIHRLTDLGRILEVILQPCGPQKLAKAFHRCLARLDTLKNDVSAQRTDGPVSEAIPDHRNLPAIEPEARPRSEIRPEAKNSEKSSDEVGSVLRAASDASQTGINASSSLSPLGKESAVEADETGTPSRLPNTNEDGGALRKTTSGSPSQPGANSVLLVDDNEINLNLLVAFMKRANRPCVAVKDGLQALEAFKHAYSDGGNGFRHVLMDITMPIMDGITATREIRNFERGNKTGQQPATILALTGQVAEATRREMFEAGGDYFLPKPVKFKELMKLLDA